MSDPIERQEAIDALDVGAELLRRVLDDADIVGAERAKYKWGLGLIESCIADVKQLPPAQPEHMHTVMLKIKKKYEKAMNTPCINNPIAWALYQTWKEYDR